MHKNKLFAGSAFLIASVLGGCANDGGLLLTTGSLGETEKAEMQRIDPACVALMAKIDELRKEGTPERIAKVATGKTKTASVKREALARMTELDSANAEFQRKCSTLAASQPAAKPSAAVTTAPAAATTTAAATTAAARTAAATASSAAGQAATNAANNATTAAKQQADAAAARAVQAATQ